jgi:hypothetical protein
VHAAPRPRHSWQNELNKCAFAAAAVRSRVRGFGGCRRLGGSYTTSLWFQMTLILAVFDMYSFRYLSPNRLVLQDQPGWELKTYPSSEYFQRTAGYQQITPYFEMLRNIILCSIWPSRSFNPLSSLHFGFTSIDAFSNPRPQRLYRGSFAMKERMI